MPDPIITRFAPSPTGFLHVGGARTALFSWLLARHTGGKFLLRIEDTDRARSTDEACTQLLDDLRWLGLQWDNDQLLFQSKRLDVYDRLISELMTRGLAYEAYDTREELNAERRAAELAKRAFIYRKGPPGAEQAARFRAEGRVAVVRLKMPVREYRFHDQVLDNDIVLPADEAQDFVIRKADGMPTYHFAVVVDDAEMRITHILRGQEHLKNTFYHLALQEALGYPRPIYGHLPIIQNLDGSKMGKRDRDKKIRTAAQQWLKIPSHSIEQLAQGAAMPVESLLGWLKDSSRQLDLSDQSRLMQVIGLNEGDLPEILVHDFRKNGYLPEVLLNFLALLGWSPGGDRERMSMDEMVRLFSIEGIGKSNAKFAREKLLAFNTEASAAAPVERLSIAMRDYLSVNPQSPLNRADDAALAKLIQMKKGFRTLREVDLLSRFFFIPDEQIVYDSDAVAKVLAKGAPQGFAVLRELRAVLADVSAWTHAELEAAVKRRGDAMGLGLGKLAQPIRVAITGNTISPPIFESIEFLGKERTIARIDRCLAVATESRSG